eukprot:jgi/Mesen1/9800/ME000007S09854
MGGFKEAFLDTPKRLRRRMFLTPTMADLMMLDRRESKGELKKELTAFDALFFGIGGVIGAGVFVVTGVAAREYAGPAVALAYVVSALSALLSAFCYAEFAVEMPVAGGAFAYLLVTFGEFPAFITCSNLLMEYVLASAAVARGFTSYFATLCGQGSNAFRIHAGFADLDPLSVALVAALCALLCRGTKGSSRFNGVVTGLNLLVVLFVIVAGLANGDHANVTRNFAPFGARGVFNAAALVFFAFVGFDSIATLAEEVRAPARDIPIGMIGSVCIVAILYVLMCVSLTMMVPYDAIDVNAPFSVAFTVVAGWAWARHLVALGAVAGLVTSLLVGLMGQARITVVIARAHLIPVAFARVHESTGTPILATLLLGGISALLSFFASLEALTSMVSIGTLVIFLMVAAALIFKRHYAPGLQASPARALLHLGGIAASALGLSLTYQVSRSWVGPAIFGALWFCATLSLQICVPQVRKPDEFRAPLMPWLASFSMLLNIFLLGTLDYHSYIRFFGWTAVAVVLYIVYGVHASHNADGGAPPIMSAGSTDAGGVKGGGSNYVRMEQLPPEAAGYLSSTSWDTDSVPLGTSGQLSSTEGDSEIQLGNVAKNF